MKRTHKKTQDKRAIFKFCSSSINKKSQQYTQAGHTSSYPHIECHFAYSQIIEVPNGGGGTGGRRFSFNFNETYPFLRHIF